MDSSETQSQPLWETAPFVVEHLRLDRKPDGSFRPASRVSLTPALRKSGLLVALPAEELKSLIFLLSFVTPNGRLLPSVQELAGAMGISEGQTRVRMERLTRFQWRERAVAHEITRSSGMDAYAPAPEVLANVSGEADDMHKPSIAPNGDFGHGIREAIIAHSREQYTKPRADVEREIAEFYGWQAPRGAQADADGEDPERSDMRRKLFHLGIGGEQAEELLDSYPAERIQRQIEWLPYRNARNLSRFLLAAIEQNYEEPRGMRK